MKSLKNTLVFILAVVAVGALAFAWKEYQELAELRATTVDPTERAALQKRVWDAEKHNQELQRQIASGRPGAVPGAAVEAPGTPGRAGGRGLVANVLDRMNDPEVQKLMAAQIRAQVERRYAKLFAQLNLPPDQLEQFKNLLVDRQQSAMDVLATANDQGITDPRDFQKLVESSQADLDSQIKTMLGDADFSQYQGFQQSQAARNVVGQLQDSLRSSGAALTDAQSEQLTQVMAQSRSAAAPDGLRGPNAPTLVTDDTIAQAQGFLGPAQVQALQQIQQQQQNQRRLNQLILQNPGANSGAPGN